MRHYHVVTNQPGYLPESEPATFTNKRDAESYASSESREIVDVYRDLETGASRYRVTGNVRQNHRLDVVPVDASDYALGWVVDIITCDDPDCEIVPVD